jgi:uncharacterized iron-regulated membrane protein
MKKKKSFRKAILKVHEILGLATGIVVFIVSVTGCCWVFRDEIEGLYSQYKNVEAEEKPMLTPTEARNVALAVLPGRQIHGTLYGKADEAIEVIFYQAEPEFYQSLYLNPYSGEVLHLKDHISGFFGFVLRGHLRLWLPKEIGSHIVAASVLLFLVILLSGLFLWWPKKKKNRQQRLTFVWKKDTRWKRKNFDLHAVAGFYVYSLAFVLAFTGLVMAYDWFYFLTYKAVGGDKVPGFVIPDGSRLDDSANALATRPIDHLLAKLRKENPSAESFEIHYPHTDSSGIYVEVSNSEGIYYDSDFRFFDQNTLEEISSPSIYGKYKDAGFADKVLRMNYDTHIGAIGGITGKVIAFFVSLIIATLPVTGILLWFGRRKKITKSQRSPVSRQLVDDEDELVRSSAIK